MPFTVSHTIVALPFRRTPVSAAAVAVGAMAPDSALFVPWLPPYTVTHSPLGALTVSLPVAIVVLALWTFAIRPAWTAVQPESVRLRLPATWVAPASAWRAWTGASAPHRASQATATLLALIGGIYSHIAWDAFTHPHGAATLALPALRATVHGHAVYSLLQDGSSVVGLAVLAIAAVRWYRRTPSRMPVAPGRAGERSRRIARILLVAAVVVGAVVWTAPLVAAPRGSVDVVGLGAIHAVQSAALGLVALTVLVGCWSAARSRVRRRSV